MIFRSLTEYVVQRLPLTSLFKSIEGLAEMSRYCCFVPNINLGALIDFCIS